MFTLREDMTKVVLTPSEEATLRDLVEKKNMWGSAYEIDNHDSCNLVTKGLVVASGKHCAVTYLGRLAYMEQCF